MANEIVKRAGGALERRGSKVAKKAPAKTGLKKAAKKAPAEEAVKSAGKKAAKHVAKHAEGKHGGHKHGSGKGTAIERVDGRLDRDELMSAAYHHLQRAAAVISLLEGESGGDLRMLLDRGVARFKVALTKDGRRSARGAYCLLRASEHLGMAGLYSARAEFAVEVAPVGSAEVAEVLRSLRGRLVTLEDEAGERETERLLAVAVELERRADAADHDLHLQYELTMAAHWICVAMEKELL